MIKDLQQVDSKEPPDLVAEVRAELAGKYYMAKLAALQQRGVAVSKSMLYNSPEFVRQYVVGILERSPGREIN